MKRALVMMVVMLGACVGDPIDGPDAGVIESDQLTPIEGTPLPGDESIARAMEWVNAQLHYCQAPNHARDYDAACTTTCNREDNVAWDPYRSDCSGLVSWAWKLPAPGRVTGQFAPFKTDLTYAIMATDLRPVAAINNSDHIMLFEKWIDKPTKARFIEEPGCSSSQPYAREYTATVMAMGKSLVVTGRATYTAIRYDEAP